MKWNSKSKQMYKAGGDLSINGKRSVERKKGIPHKWVCVCFFSIISAGQFTIRLLYLLFASRSFPLLPYNVACSVFRIVLTVVLAFYIIFQFFLLWFQCQTGRDLICSRLLPRSSVLGPAWGRD